MEQPRNLNPLPPAFLAGQKQLMIGGKWHPALSGQTIASINPSTGEVIGQIARGGREDIDLAVKAARDAFEGEWSRWTPYDRQRLLLRIHDLIEKHFDELAAIETIDMGAPITRTRALKAWQSQAILRSMPPAPAFSSSARFRRSLSRALPISAPD